MHSIVVVGTEFIPPPPPFFIIRSFKIKEFIQKSKVKEINIIDGSNEYSGRGVSQTDSLKGLRERLGSFCFSKMFLLIFNCIH